MPLQYQTVKVREIAPNFLAEEKAALHRITTLMPLLKNRLGTSIMKVNNEYAFKVLGGTHLLNQEI